MINKILSFFGFGTVWNTEASSRRTHVRYSGLQAEVLVGDRIYSVRDWSMGGVAFDTGADLALRAGDNVQVILKFRFPHDTITIQQQARIVRAVKRGVAVEFAPLPVPVRREFERVLDSLHAQSFLESQVV